MSSAAVVIGALRVKRVTVIFYVFVIVFMHVYFVIVNISLAVYGLCKIIVEL